MEHTSKIQHCYKIKATLLQSNCVWKNSKNFKKFSACQEPNFKAESVFEGTLMHNIWSKNPNSNNVFGIMPGSQQRNEMLLSVGSLFAAWSSFHARCHPTGYFVFLSACLDNMFHHVSATLWLEKKDQGRCMWGLTGVNAYRAQSMGGLVMHAWLNYVCKLSVSLCLQVCSEIEVRSVARKGWLDLLKKNLS